MLAMARESVTSDDSAVGGVEPVLNTVIPAELGFSVELVSIPGTAVVSVVALTQLERPL
jgi:hypothetical protein